MAFHGKKGDDFRAGVRQKTPIKQMVLSVKKNVPARDEGGRDIAATTGNDTRTRVFQ
jgi:hypothetical protein